jgi:hypothetical protein
MLILQKTIWLHYLLIGISVPFLVAGCGKKDVEYRMRVELTFINTTDKVISFQMRSGISSSNLESVTITPRTQSKTFTYNVEGVDKKMNPGNCCQDVLIDVYGGRGLEGVSQTLKFNNNLCVTHLNEKSVILANYTTERITDRHFRYSYTFTENDFENAEPCK